MNVGSLFHFLRTFVLTVLLWLICLIAVFSQDYIFDTEIINVEDGLPHRNTYDILQDKEGFIWVSTLRGISRYDGYRFKNYDRKLLNIPETFIADHLAVDAQNRIWYSGNVNDVGMYSGVIDSHQDTIYTMEAISGGRFTSEDIIYTGNCNINKDDVIIASREGVIYLYDGDFYEIYRAPRPFPENVFCQALPDGSYWVVHSSYPKTTQNEIFRIKNGKILQHVKFDQWIKRIVTSYPQLIIETDDKLPVIHWRLEKDRFVPFGLKGHAAEDINALLQFHQDYICYLTESELLVQDKQGDIIYRFDQFKFLDRKLNGCQNTMTDRRGIVWATTSNGIIKLSARKNPFKNLGVTNNIRGIYRDGAQLWTDKVIIDLEDNTQKTIPLQDRIGIQSYYKDYQGHLWMLPDNKMVIRYIPGEDRYVHYYFDSMSFSHLVFQNAVTKTFWLCRRNGLFRFDVNTGKTKPFALPIDSKDLYIRHFHQNAKGVWIATNKGIFLMDAHNEIIVQYYTTTDGLANDDINYIYEDQEGIFWIGSKGGGLLRWDIRTNNFRQYNQENVLSNDNIYAVYEDEFNTLWLPSDYGLMAFDKQTETAKVYLPEHGISHEEFNTFGHFRDADSTLYFGGLKGITSFHPRDLQEQDTVLSPLYTTRVQVLEKDAENYTDKTGVFKTAKKIVLKPSDRILEVELALLDYERLGKNQFAYKLSGKQEQWVYTRENKLSIINPPYGKYDLVVKARGASGSWQTTPLTIPMHVKMPFYMQWWFILGAIVFVIVAIVTGFRWRVQTLKKDRERLEGEVQKRTQQIAKDKQLIEQQAEDLKALDKAKSRFFANITHEFRTPLTLVAGPIEQIVKNLPPPGPLKQKLSGVLKNTRNLMELINQLLDLSKLEGGRMKTEISHGDIVLYTHELVGRFQPLAEKKRLQLEFSADKDVWEIHMDIDKWAKIVHNLISNAMKFTPEGGRVSASLKQVRQGGQDCIQFSIKDTGTGIAVEDIDHIFDRFYQADASSTRVQGGTGIGLSLVKELVELLNGSVSVESTVGEGSEFIVIMPLAVAPDFETLPERTLTEEVLLPSLQTKEGVEDNEVVLISDTKDKSEEKLELLIIEDNAEMRAYIRSCIDVSVYNISEVANGEEGITKAVETVPDLIISDVMMPKKNGFEVTRAIRSHVATSHIPLILLTAKASLESRLKGLERGADVYLTKPFSPQELVLRIKKLIEIRKLLQQRYRSQDDPQEKNTEFEKEDGFILELKSYILDNISEPNLQVETISRHFAMSRIQLYRKLKALINRPIGDYIRSIRLEKAVNLLNENQLNITEIAYEIGFSSVSNFSKAFKKAYGRAPSAMK